MDTSFSAIPTKNLNLVPWKKKPFQSGDLLIKREFAPVGANCCIIVLTSWSPSRMPMGVGEGKTAASYASAPLRLFWLNKTFKHRKAGN